MKHLMEMSPFRARRGLKQRMALGENADANRFAVLLDELDLLRVRVSAALVLANLEPVELLTVQEIQLRVAVVFNLHPNHMRLHSRCAENIATGRMVAMALAREFTGLSLAAIGAEFGGRDHGTVFNAVRRVREMCEVEPNIAWRVAALRKFFDKGTLKKERQNL